MKHKYDVYVSLGYNCEVSFRIQDYFKRKIDSYPFSWVYITDFEKFVRALFKLDDILKHEVEFLPWGMILDKKYGLSFHPKINKKELFFEDGNLNLQKADEALAELKERFLYLLSKFKKLLASDKRTLFVIKVRSEDLKSEWLKVLYSYLKDNYLTGNFKLLVVTEKSKVDIYSINWMESSKIGVGMVEYFAKDSETETGGDIDGWMRVLAEA